MTIRDTALEDIRDAIDAHNDALLKAKFPVKASILRKARKIEASYPSYASVAPK